MIHAEYVFLKIIILALGLVVAFAAFRAYRRYQSRPLLFVSIGFIFIAVGDGLEGLLFHFTPLTLYQSSLVHTGLMILGMTCVLYSIYGGTTTRWREVIGLNQP